MTHVTPALAEDIARELGVRPTQIAKTIALFDDDATVPFIARYRKEVTDGLTDTQLRQVQQRLVYLRDLAARRQVIVQQLTEAKQLTAELAAAIAAVTTKAALEDLYLPYRPKRQTKAALAEAAGLLPLAELLLNNPSQSPEQSAAAFIAIEHGILDTNQALDGARHILMERFSEHAGLLVQLRAIVWDNGLLTTEAMKGKQGKKNSGIKFNDYINYSEAIRKIPSHRALALFRARRAQAIQLQLKLPDPECGVQAIVSAFTIDTTSVWLMETARLAWKNRLFRSLEAEAFARLRELADEEAIRVFSRNLRALLLTAPAGQVVTMGVDPGYRAGIKLAVVDANGQYLDGVTVFPYAPHNAREEAIVSCAKLIAKYAIQHISIGNGTGSREATQLVAECLQRYPDMQVKSVVVNEAGASVYSASSLAGQELPDVDVTLRGAVSIARRLQDPLAELVKIEPQSIGVGQYQHDVNPVRLAQRLQEVVEDCVNAVGVNLNTASAELLTYVAGFNQSLARQVVLHRETHGSFRHRQALLEVPRLGEKTFQQAAGFLRIHSSEHPLDCSAVHPEAYHLVDRLAAQQGCKVSELIGNGALLAQVDVAAVADECFGIATVRDVLTELAKPGRDPRVKLPTPQFKAGVETIEQLSVGMLLEGAVSNVTNFGAFVDIGVHQDGLVHRSAFPEGSVRDPHHVLQVGDLVQVKVVEIDCARRRIGLSMRITEERAKPKPQSKRIAAQPVVTNKRLPEKKSSPSPRSSATPFNTAMADALTKLKQGST